MITGCQVCLDTDGILYTNREEGSGGRKISTTQAKPLQTGARSQTNVSQHSLSQIFQSVDALVPLDILYQMTVSTSHGIKV